MSQENAKITDKVKEFDQELVKLILHHNKRLNHDESYQAVVLMLAHSLGGYIIHQQKNGKSQEEVFETMRCVISEKWNNADAPLNKPH